MPKQKNYLYLLFGNRIRTGTKFLLPIKLVDNQIIQFECEELFSGINMSTTKNTIADKY